METLQIIKALIKRQFDLQARVLLEAGALAPVDNVAMPQDALSAALQYREGIVPMLKAPSLGEASANRQEVSEFFLDLMSWYLHSFNQFANIDPATRRRLRSVYDIHLDNLATVLESASSIEHCRELLGRVMNSHFEKLKNAVASMDPELARPVTCAVYSPQFQMSILGLETSNLLSPILDLGCGDGALVRCLQDLGLDAHGIDRYAPDFPNFQKTDWREFHPAESSWGTIISHLAFSNHFIHEHLNPNGNPVDCAMAYMELLSALRPGGSLVYAPGLPFIENLLPASKYAVKRINVPAPQGIELGIMVEFAYACRVTRL